MRKITDHQLSTNSLLNWVLQNKHAGALCETFHVSMFGNHLRQSYKVLPKNEGTCEQDLRIFMPEKYSKTPFHNVAEMQEILESSGFFLHFFLHGSTADLKYIDGWSDFDAIAVVKDVTLLRLNELLKTCADLDNVMRRTDEHQHHGIHFVHERELQNWPNLYLPTSLFQDFVCLLGTKKIRYSGVDSSEHELKRFLSIAETFRSAMKTGELRHHAKDGRYLRENYADMDTMYQMKYFLSVIMLLPALWLNLRGIYCTKGESFELIREYFSDSQLELILKASEIRASWNNKRHSAGDRIPDFLKKLLGNDYIKRADVLISSMVAQIENDSTRL